MRVSAEPQTKDSIRPSVTGHGKACRWGDQAGGLVGDALQTCQCQHRDSAPFSGIKGLEDVSEVCRAAAGTCSQNKPKRPCWHF